MMSNIPVINMVKTGQNIIKLREKNGLSVKDLQNIFGFTTPQAIYKWQHGTALPTIDNLVVLATVFHVHLEDILAVEGKKEIQDRNCHNEIIVGRDDELPEQEKSGVTIPISA